jgi:glycosyltransferase 2 family protein
MKLGRVLRILVSLILLVIVITNVGVDRLWVTLTTIAPIWFLIALAFHLSGIVIRTFRWAILVRSLGVQVPFGRLFYLYMAGTFFNTFLPTGIGGDVVKIIDLTPESGGARAFSTVFADRLTGILGSSLIALTVALFDPVDVPPTLVALIALVSGGILLASLLLTQQRRIDRVMRHVPGWSKLLSKGKIRRVYEALTAYSLGVIIRATLISLPFTLTVIASQYALARGLNLQVPVQYFALFIPMTALVQMIPISFNGLGVREGTYAALFGTVGVAGEQAVAMSLMYYVLRVVTGLMGGLMYLIGNLRAARSKADPIEKPEEVGTPDRTSRPSAQ